MPASTGAQYKRVLRKAAQIIESEGWVQNDYYFPGRGYCVLGAVFTAAKDQAALDGKDPEHLVTWACLEELEKEVRRHDSDSMISVADWNDYRAQSADDAIALLKRVGKVNK